MLEIIYKKIASLIFKLLVKHNDSFKDIEYLKSLKNVCHNSKISKKSKLYSPYKIFNSEIENYTYISNNCIISSTKIGRFCSIGPNLNCGWGIHPLNSISTAPMFYSSQKQNGITLSNINKIQETKPISIGNDVFIGMNVTILDGITIGDGAVIGAGAVVSKDIPPYAIAIGNPIKVVRYRFSEKQIEDLLFIKWWDWDDEKLKEVEKYFDNIDAFIEKHKTPPSL